MSMESSAPYLSVVVTTRNDDHGGDPLKRLQAFVNTFAEQCRRTHLDAEVIVVEWNPPPDKPSRLWHQRDGKIEEIVFPNCNQYTIEADRFSLAILNDTAVPTPLSDALANMKVIDALRASHRSGTWEVL